MINFLNFPVYKKSKYNMCSHFIDILNADPYTDSSKRNNPLVKHLMEHKAENTIYKICM